MSLRGREPSIPHPGLFPEIHPGCPTVSRSKLSCSPSTIMFLSSLPTFAGERRPPSPRHGVPLLSLPTPTHPQSSGVAASLLASFLCFGPRKSLNGRKRKLARHQKRLQFFFLPQPLGLSFESPDLHYPPPLWAWTFYPLLSVLGVSHPSSLPSHLEERGSLAFCRRSLWPDFLSCFSLVKCYACSFKCTM